MKTFFHKVKNWFLKPCIHTNGSQPPKQTPVVLKVASRFDFNKAMTQHADNLFASTAGKEPRVMLVDNIIDHLNSIKHHILMLSGIGKFSNSSHTGFKFNYNGILYVVNIRADKRLAIEMRCKNNQDNRHIPIFWAQTVLLDEWHNAMVVKKSYVTFESPLTLGQFSVWLNTEESLS